MMNYNDAPQPVSLQPFKALKIVFMIVAIVFTALLVVYGMIYYFTLSSVPIYGAHDQAAVAGVGFATLFLMLVFVLPLWILFFVFNGKYKKRLEHNRSLGIYNE